jgi:intein-encoded DNA endonuclease-like protein
MPRTLRTLFLNARVRVYERVLEARREFGSSYETIAKNLDLPSSTVHNWIVGKNSPLGSFVIPKLTPTPSLSYLAGAMLGDGDLVRSTSYHYLLRLRVKDRDFAEKVCSCFNSVLGRPRHVRKDGNGFYVVRFWSRMLYEYLSDTRSIQKTVDRFPSEFIKGFADAEGTPAISVGRSRKSSLSFFIVMVNTDLSLLRWVRHLMKSRFGIDSRLSEGKMHPSMWGRVPCYYLTIGRREDQLSFADNIGFAIHRKRQKMLIALELLQRLGPLKAGAEWQRIFEKRGRIWIMKDLGNGAPDEI